MRLRGMSLENFSSKDKCRRQVLIPLEYKGILLNSYRRMDLLVEDHIVIKVGTCSLARS